MTDICRLCLSIISSSSIPFNKDHVLQGDQIKYMLPEIDLTLTPTFDLCDLCVHLLSTAYIFKRGCLKTEETIKKYISQHNNIPLNLHEVKKLESCNSSSILDILEDVKIEPLYVEVNSESDTDVREQLDVTFVCNECHKIFGDKETLKKHQKECLIYKYDGCEKILVIKDECDTHCEPNSIPKKRMNSISTKILHQGSESDVHNLQSSIKRSTTGDISQSAFSSQMELHNYHKLPHENLPKKHRCNLCAKEFTWQSLFTKHMISHTEARPHKCQICHTHFKVRSTLERHIRMKHEINWPFKCKICSKLFTLSERSALEEHMMSHATEPPFKCHLCDKSFSRKYNLNVHIKLHKRENPNIEIVKVEESRIMKEQPPLSPL